MELILRIKMQELEHQQSSYNKHFIYILIYLILERNCISYSIRTWFEQSVVCIGSDLKGWATVDPVFKMLSFIGVSWAHSVLVLLLLGLERTEQF